VTRPTKTNHRCSYQPCQSFHCGGVSPTKSLASTFLEANGVACFSLSFFRPILWTCPWPVHKLDLSICGGELLNLMSASPTCSSVSMIRYQCRSPLPAPGNAPPKSHLMLYHDPTGFSVRVFSPISISRRQHSKTWDDVSNRMHGPHLFNFLAGTSGDARLLEHQECWVEFQVNMQF
jgi:hypothetical protein